MVRSSEVCLPKCTSASRHDEDRNLRRVGEFVENFLSTGQRSFAIDSVEWDVFPTQVPLNEIESVCPT
jgi:hypothetical protein